MHLKADLLPVPGGELPEFTQRAADLLKGAVQPEFLETPLGRTLTPVAPTSRASTMYSFVASMSRRSFAGSAVW